MEKMNEKLWCKTHNCRAYIEWINNENYPCRPKCPYEINEINEGSDIPKLCEFVYKKE